MKLNRKLSSLLISALMTAGCGTVRVYKVDVASDGKETVNTSVEGIPYYLPRPYMQVYDPFVIAAEPFLVKASLTPDGKYVQLQSLPEELKKHAHALFTPDGKAIKAISLPENLASAVRALQAATNQNGGATSTTNTNQESTIPKNDETPKKEETKTGLASVKATSTTDFYITPGRKYFDIVYLPDYSDKRIIQVRSRMGIAKLSATLAQGWSLAALNAEVDNSEVVKRILETYDVGLEIGKKVAAASLFPPAAALQGLAHGITLKGGDEVTCKLTVSTVVAPGLYPIPKDVELPATASINTDRSVLSMANHMGFNTYKVIVVEALRPSGDAPLNFTGGVPSPKSPTDAGMSAPVAAEEVGKLVSKFLSASEYKERFVNANAEEGSKEGSFVVTVILTEVPNDKDKIAELERDLTKKANSAVAVKKVTIEKVNAKAK